VAADGVGVDAQQAGRVTHPAAIERVGIDLLLDARLVGLVGIGELEAPEAALAAPARGAHAAAAVLAQLIAPAVGAGDVLLVYHVETKARIMPEQLLEYITLFSFIWTVF
jgi:hypothetical protein